MEILALSGLAIAPIAICAPLLISLLPLNLCSAMSPHTSLRHDHPSVHHLTPQLLDLRLDLSPGEGFLFSLLPYFGLTAPNQSGTALSTHPSTQVAGFLVYAAM